MKETLKKAAKIWTYVSIPLELLLVGHGVYTKNAGEVLLGAGLLAADVFFLKWLDRDKKTNQMEQLKSTTPAKLLNFRGSNRLNSNPQRLALVA